MEELMCKIELSNDFIKLVENNKQKIEELNNRVDTIIDEMKSLKNTVAKAFVTELKINNMELNNNYTIEIEEDETTQNRWFDFKKHKPKHKKLVLVSFKNSLFRHCKICRYYLYENKFILTANNEEIENVDYWMYFSDPTTE